MFYCNIERILFTRRIIVAFAARQYLTTRTTLPVTAGLWSRPSAGPSKTHKTIFCSASFSGIAINHVEIVTGTSYSIAVRWIVVGVKDNGDDVDDDDCCLFLFNTGTVMLIVGDVEGYEDGDEECDDRA